MAYTKAIRTSNDTPNITFSPEAVARKNLFWGGIVQGINMFIVEVLEKRLKKKKPS